MSGSIRPIDPQIGTAPADRDSAAGAGPQIVT